VLTFAIHPDVLSVNALGPSGDRGTNGRVPGTKDFIRPSRLRIASEIKRVTAHTAAVNYESKMMYRSASAVIVGVDGSQAAANAVRWAIDEAISRDVPLRIVHVAGVEEQPADDVHRKIEYAETALRAATAVADATGDPFKVEADLLWGPSRTSR
jgi:hypothetical protein